MLFRSHVSSFGKLSFVHVTVDTFSHVIIATACTGEAVKDVIQHYLLYVLCGSTTVESS